MGGGERGEGDQRHSRRGAGPDLTECVEAGELGASRPARRLVKDAECSKGAETVRMGRWARRRRKATLSVQRTK